MNTAVASPAEIARPPVRLRINEIFHSLQGESSRVGLPTTFVRLTGCPLRCVWCDTAHAFHAGETQPLETILRTVAGFGARYVTVTGGEPLAQKGCLALLTALCDAGYDVSLETSGALDIAGVDPRVSRIVDLKAPGSGEEGRNLWSNVALLTPRDEVKFVLDGRADYDWMRQVIDRHDLAARCPLLVSPVHGKLAPRELAEWVLVDGLPVRLQVQLHKLLWGEVPGH